MDGSIDFRLDTRIAVAGASTVGRGEIVWFERRVPAPGFTARDLVELRRWGSQHDRAVVLDDDPAAFAQLYEGSAVWASWAIAREDGMLLVWDCVTFADVGRFGCMVDALEALSGAGGRVNETTSNVISLAMARQRRDGDGWISGQ